MARLAADVLDQARELWEAEVERAVELPLAVAEVLHEPVTQPHQLLPRTLSDFPSLCTSSVRSSAFLERPGTPCSPGSERISPVPMEHPERAWGLRPREAGEQLALAPPPRVAFRLN